MSEMEDRLNSLSPEELKALDSDTEMLSAFKQKYGGPNTPTLSNILPKMLPVAASIMPENAIKDVGQNIVGLGQSLKAGLYDIPKAIGTLPRELAHGLVTGNISNPNDTELGKFTNTGVQGIEHSIPTSPEEAIKTVIEHPVSTALFASGLMPEETGVESGAKGFAEQISANADSKLAKLNKKLALIPENATKMEGYNQPIPTQEDLAQGVQNVLKAHKEVNDIHGNILAKAKEAADLPVSVEDKTQSIRKYGNEFNLDLNKPLSMPENLTTNAPKMEEPPIRPLQKGDVVTATHPTEPPVQIRYEMPGIMTGVNDPGFNLMNPVKNPSAEWSHPVNSTLAQSTLESYGYKIPEGVTPPEYEAPKSASPMPYKISPTKTPEDLNTEISRFMKNQDYISDADKVKAASYYQDKINNMVDWNKKQGDIEGMLKTQHKGLQEVIGQASPDLQNAKTNWSDLQKNLDLVSSKLDPKEPGAAQSYLKRLFTSDSPAAQDSLKQLSYLEKLSGKPIITNLFKQFAGKSFESLVSRPGREILEAGTGAGMALMGHPAGALGAAGLLAAQSPRILGGIESAISKAPTALAKFTPMAALQTAKQGFPLSDEARSKLQSLKDRLKNAK